MRNIALGLLALVVLCVGLACSGGSSNYYLQPDPEVSFTPGLQTEVHASEEVRALRGFHAHGLEIDGVRYAYEETFGHKIDVVIHFHEPSDHDDDLRAHYHGDGVIGACWHSDHLPRMFCLHEAFSSLVRDIYGGDEAYADLEERIATAERKAINAMRGLYQFGDYTD